MTLRIITFDLFEVHLLLNTVRQPTGLFELSNKYIARNWAVNAFHAKNNSKVLKHFEFYYFQKILNLSFGRSVTTNPDRKIDIDFIIQLYIVEINMKV